METLHKFMLKDTKKNKEMVFPVTPPSFEISHGIRVETINIHAVGDVVLPGYQTLSEIRIDCLLPANNYPFNQPKAKTEPYDYIKKFKKWCEAHTILRLVISGTNVNLPVLLTEYTYGEKDGTKDVYATLTLKEYRKLTAKVKPEDDENTERGSEEKTEETKVHVVKQGDTLCAICRKYYGDSSLNGKLATYNSIKNKNLIYPGQKIKLPPKDVL